ncbi:hypothetical protein F5876DRAFT_45771, partial [Lentinula aff. lateritia]
TGHCFQIRGTTHLHAVVNPDTVQVFGRWKSSAFLKYWRNLESLASLHLHRHHSQQSHYSKLSTKNITCRHHCTTNRNWLINICLT